MKAVIFDLWGTLAYVRGRNFLKRILDSLGISYNRANVILLEQTMMSNDFDDKCQRLSEVLGKSVDKDKFKKLCDFRINKTAIYDDVIVNLKRLKKDNLIFLLSNTDNLDDINALQDILPYFDDVFLSCNTGHLKPDPRAFKDILDKHGLNPNDVIMVGDSKQSDGGSENVGIKFMLINRAGNNPVAISSSHTISSLSEVR